MHEIALRGLDSVIPNLLKATLQDPRIPFYIQSLTVIASSLHWAEAQSWDEMGLVSQEPQFHTTHRAKAEQGLFSGWEEIGPVWSYYHERKWFEQLIEDQDSIIAPLLITRLTNLTILERQDFNYDDKSFTFLRAFQQMFACPGVDPLDYGNDAIFSKEQLKCLLLGSGLRIAVCQKY